MAAPPCCPVCEVHLPSVCPSCVQISIADKRQKLKAASARRDATKEKLNKRLAAVGAADDQRRWRIEWAEARAQLQDGIRKTTDDLAKGMEKLERRKRNVKIRSGQLADANSKLYNKRNEILVQYFPDVLRSESLRQTFVNLELTRLRRQTIQKLRSVLPLRLTLVDVGSSMRQYVTICGIRLPDGTEPTVDSGPELSAALGYLLQFVGMAATYLGAPILHVAGHGVSSSSIWQRESYWKTKSSTGSFPLYLPRTGSASASRSSSLYSSLTAPADKKPAPAPETAPTGEPPLSKSASETRAVSQLRQGIALLKRSVACLCAQQWAATSLPRDAAARMSPFFGLAVLMSVLGQERDAGWLPRPETPDRAAADSPAPLDGTASWAQASFTRQAGFAMAESLTAAKATATTAARRQSADGHPRLIKRAEGRSSGRSRRASDVSDVRDTDLEGWDVVDRPADILPPPPSEPDNIAHWTRAMFVDARK